MDFDYWSLHWPKKLTLKEVVVYFLSLEKLYLLLSVLTHFLMILNIWLLFFSRQICISKALKKLLLLIIFHQSKQWVSKSILNDDIQQPASEGFRWLHLPHKDSSKDFLICPAPPRNFRGQKRNGQASTPQNPNPHPDSITWIAFVNQNALLCTSGLRLW